MNEVCLLGMVLNIQLSRQWNKSIIVKKKTFILHKLFEFDLPRNYLVVIYVLYIQSVLESSDTVWHSSITQGKKASFLLAAFEKNG